MLRMSGEAESSQLQGLSLLQRSARLSVAALVALILAVSLLFRVRAEFDFASDRSLSNYFAYHQDLEVAVLVLVFLLALSLVKFRRVSAVRLHAQRVVALAALLVFLLAYAGVHWVFGGFGLSLDEVMADFDRTIIGRGGLFASLAPEWRDFRDALQPMFLLKVEGAQVWSSAYLPGNAAIRALLGALGDASLSSPLEAALSVLLVYAIALKLRPGDRTFGLVATLLFVTSSQFLVTAMTSYAMTAHLAFNLAWLWLVLHDRGWSRIGALLVTVVATGLHQMPFHPLFVAPFLLWLAWERRWLLVLLYGGATAAAALFWTFYWPLALDLAGVKPEAAAAVGGVYLVDRAAAMMVAAFSGISIVFTTDNLLRLVTWQNPLLWPLCIVAIATLRRQPPIVWALLAGIVLMLAAMLVIMPYQGHGWGYRYCHGILGNFALLAAFGWRAIDAPHPEPSAAVPRLVLLSVLMSLMVLLPVRAVQAHLFTTPYRRADAAIARIDADIVIIDPAVRWFSQDLIRNEPFLASRPLRMIPNETVLARAGDLCRSHRVRLIHHGSPELAGLRVTGSKEDRLGAINRMAYLRQAGCSLPPRRRA